MKKNNTPDNLTLCATAAINAGMSYGRYMAKYGWHPPIMRQQQEEHEDNMIVCPECGTQFYKTHHSRVYCSYDCSRRRADRMAKQRYLERKAIEHEQSTDIWLSGAEQAAEKR